MNTTRNHAIDALRTLSIFFIVAIHTAGDYVEVGATIDANFYAMLALQSIARIGTPLFVLISGAFALGRKPYSWREFYRHRLPRVLLIFAVWLPVYYLWFAIKGDDLAPLWQGFWRGESFLHFWFLLMISLMYLLTPLLEEIVRRISSRGVYVLGFALLSLAMLSRLWDVTLSSAPFFPLYYLYFLGYFVLGYALRRYPPRRIGVVSFVYVLALLCTYLAAYYSIQQGRGTYPLDRFSPLIAVSSLSFFAIFASRPMSKMRPNILSRMSHDVLGIYVLHIIVLNIITKPFLLYCPKLMAFAYLHVPIRLFLAIVGSYFLTKLLRKLPFLGRTLS